MKNFQLTAAQLAQFNKWSATRLTSKAADGAQFEFRFLITGIGIKVSVFDHVSKESLDLTDYDSW